MVGKVFRTVKSYYRLNHRHQGAWYRREHPAPSRLPTALLRLSDTRTCPEMSTGVQPQNEIGMKDLVSHLHWEPLNLRVKCNLVHHF